MQLGGFPQSKRPDGWFGIQRLFQVGVLLLTCILLVGLKLFHKIVGSQTSTAHKHIHVCKFFLCSYTLKMLIEVFSILNHKKIIFCLLPLIIFACFPISVGAISCANIIHGPSSLASEDRN